MKKMLLIAFAIGLMSTSAMAAMNGKIGKIVFQSDGITKVELIKEDMSVVISKVVGTPEAQQTIIASVLTAKSLNANVGFEYGVDSGSSIAGWTKVIIY